MNVELIQKQVKKAIAIKPTNILLKRIEKVSNGMNGWIETEVEVASLDIFFDDTNRNQLSISIKEPGITQNMRNFKMYAVTENFEIKSEDFFNLNGTKYKVSYPGEVVENVYISDLEMVK